MIRLFLFLLPTLLPAEFLRIEMGFGGMDCASCTEFVEGRLGRNRNVKSAHVDKQKGLLIVELKPENKMRLDQVRDLVQQSGFTPQQMRVVVNGVPRADGSFMIPELDLAMKASDPKDLLRPHLDKRVRVEGEVKFAADRTQTLEIGRIDL